MRYIRNMEIRICTYNGRTVRKPENYLIKCQGCVFNCNLTEFFSMQLLDCVGTQYIIWPAENAYLARGIASLLKDTHPNNHSRGLLFVDFTHYYLSIFSNDSWLNMLVKVPMDIILLADQTMEPLAHFWKNHDKRITDALSVRKHRPFSVKNRTRIGSINRNRGIKPATLMEVKVLELLMSGHNAREVGEMLNISSKNVFNLQYSLERKLGKTLKEMIIL